MRKWCVTPSCIDSNATDTMFPLGLSQVGDIYPYLPLNSAELFLRQNLPGVPEKCGKHPLHCSPVTNPRRAFLSVSEAVVAVAGVFARVHVWYVYGHTSAQLYGDLDGLRLGGSARVATVHPPTHALSCHPLPSHLSPMAADPG